MKKLALIALFPLTAMAGPFAEVSVAVREHYEPAAPELSVSQCHYTHRGCEQTVSWVNYSPYDSKSSNPYTNIKLGYSWRISDSLRASISVEHESSIATNKDRGLNSMRFAVRWGD